MPGKANRKLAQAIDETGALIFSWQYKHPGSFWLWGFIVLSLLFHVAGFYLFQVVYPSSGRVEPFPARVLILDEKNPANAILLQELNDRLVFLQPASDGSKSRKNMDDFAVPFRPSFVDRKPPFKKPVATNPTTLNPANMNLSGKVSIFPPFNAARSLKTSTSPKERSDITSPATPAR